MDKKLIFFAFLTFLILGTVKSQNNSNTKKNGIEQEIDYAKIDAENGVIWNEKDYKVRRKMIEKLYSPKVKFIDPYSIAVGIDGVNNFIEGLHKRFPTYKFSTEGAVLGHHNVMKVNWIFGPKETPNTIQGTDVVFFSGKMIKTYYVFIKM